MPRWCRLPPMLAQTARVLRQSWTGGLLSALLVTVFLIASTWPAASGSTQASPHPTTAVATPSADYEASGPGEAHAHAEASHCEDGDVTGTDNRGGAVKLLRSEEH